MALHYVFIACPSHYSPAFILRSRYDGSPRQGKMHHKTSPIKDGTANLSCASSSSSIHGRAAPYKTSLGHQDQLVQCSHQHPQTTGSFLATSSAQLPLPCVFWQPPGTPERGKFPKYIDKELLGSAVILTALCWF